VILLDHYPEHENVSLPPLIHNSELGVLIDLTELPPTGQHRFRGLMLERHML